jgi:O-antigen ligase
MALGLLTASLVTSKLGPIGLWYGGGARFRGWAENPNQLAMFMHPMPFLGWYLLQRTHGLLRRLPYFLAIIVCMVVGLATDSDALKVAWVGAPGVIAMWAWCRLVVNGRGNSLHVAIAYFLVPAVVVIFAIGLGTQIESGLEEIANQVYEKGDRGQIGMVLLMNGLEAISHSPLVGWGPGSYSGLDRPFDSREAHNTFVDWGMNTGGLGMMLYLGLLFWCTVRAIRSGSPWLLGALVATLGDSLFGYSLRHPFFWLVLVLVAVLPGPTARRTASPATLPQEGTMGDAEPPAYAARRSRGEPSASATRMP